MKDFQLLFSVEEGSTFSAMITAIVVFSVRLAVICMFLEFSPAVFLRTGFYFFCCVLVLFVISRRSSLHKNNPKVKYAFDLWRVSVPTEASPDVQEQHWEETWVYGDPGLEGWEDVAQPGSSPPIPAVNGPFVQPQHRCTVVGCCRCAVCRHFLAFSGETFSDFPCKLNFNFSSNEKTTKMRNK